MGSYLANFTVYAMAMTGLIFFAVFIYKKVMNGGFHSNKSNFLSIEETMNINPRKSLIVVRAGEEKFLIASDIDKTTLISKLENTSEQKPKKYFQELIEEPQKPQKNRVVDINIYDQQEPVILETIKEKNPNSPRKNMDYREPDRTVRQRPIKKSEHNRQPNITTIKDMAKRINQL